MRDTVRLYVKLFVAAANEALLEYVESEIVARSRVDPAASYICRQSEQRGRRLLVRHSR